MIGIFDSGMGGIFALTELRRLCPRIDIAFFADKENAPYGTKSEDELIKLVITDIDKLRDAGAEKILMACCTASTVYAKLPEKYRDISIPIVEPTAARALEASGNLKIGVLSTEATRRSGAFTRAILTLAPSATVINTSAGELVSLAENGERDGALTERGKRIIKKAISPFLESEIDTLILGCTHFAYFEREIQNILGIPVVNSARVGAEEMAGAVPDRGNGSTVYLL